MQLFVTDERRLIRNRCIVFSLGNLSLQVDNLYLGVFHKLEPRVSTMRLLHFRVELLVNFKLLHFTLSTQWVSHECQCVCVCESMYVCVLFLFQVVYFSAWLSTLCKWSTCIYPLYMSPLPNGIFNLLGSEYLSVKCQDFELKCLRFPFAFFLNGKYILKDKNKLLLLFWLFKRQTIIEI